jgi:hypothetical protein
MSFTVGRMLRGQPRFFAGRYERNIPVTTGEPDKAREYGDRDTAQIVATLFDALDGVRIGKPQRNWIVVELPEAWT